MPTLTDLYNNSGNNPECSCYYSLMLRHSKATDSNFSKTFLLMRTIQDIIPKLRKRFSGISITSINKHHRWGVINYTKENHRDPIIHYIKRHICDNLIVKQKNIKKIYSHSPTKDNQYKVWSKDSGKIQKLRNFLLKFDYCSNTPTLRSRNNFTEHELTWITPPQKARQMQEHWQGMNIPLYIVKSDINLHVDK